MIRAALVAALVLVAGCKKEPATGAGLEEVNRAFAGAGLKLEPFVPTDGRRFAAQLCMTGKIEGVEALLCQYASPEASRLGKKAGEEWVGSAPTGTAIDRGQVLLVLADRARVDPNGKTIHKIIQAFQGKK